MGVWGTGIFQDDTACDVRNSYKDLLGEGLNGPQATARVLKEFKSSLADPDESGVVWLALASEQWRCGRLEPDTLRQALAVIDSGSDLKRWEHGSKDLELRRKALDELRSQITSPQPAEKKVAKRIPCECPWRLGDIFAYRLLSDRLILFRVIDTITDKGGTYPVCELFDWTGTEIPSRKELKQINTRRSRPDYKHTIYSLTLVGLRPKWAKRVQDTNLNVAPLHKRILSFVAGTSIRFEREASSIVHFKFLDNFLKEWFLLD